jgi:Leucine-rich repeat (LRR) protein
VTRTFAKSKIRRLSLRGNSLKYVSTDGLGDSLEFLDLAGNRITSLPDGKMSALGKLRHL